MAELGLEGVIRGRRRRTTVSEPSAPRPPDLVDRDFTASRPDQLWVADMTYVRTWSGWVYVAFVLDVHSRMIVGWQVPNHTRTELPLDALEMALWRRRIKKDSGLIHHSSEHLPIQATELLLTHARPPHQRPLAIPRAGAARLSIVAALAAVEKAEFAYVRDLVEITDSALSKQVSRLEEAGWVTVEKGQVGRRPRTWLRLTEDGLAVYRRHLAALTAIAGPLR